MTSFAFESWRKSKKEMDEVSQKTLTEISQKNFTNRL